MAERRVIPIDEVASEMLISRSMVYKLINAGELRTIHVGRKHLVILDSYLALKQKLKRKQNQIANARHSIYAHDDVVYFIEAPSVQLIKIGTTINLAKRLKAITTHSPVPLNVLGCIPGSIGTEKRLHRRFARSRERGEWFKASPALRQFIEKVLIERGLNPMVQK